MSEGAVTCWAATTVGPQRPEDWSMPGRSNSGRTACAWHPTTCGSMDRANTYSVADAVANLKVKPPCYAFGLRG